jgi:hypothetical protein
MRHALCPLPLAPTPQLATRNRIQIPEDRRQRSAVRGQNERIRSDRRYVYEAGSLKQPAQGRVKVIENTVLEKERSKEFELSKSDRFKISRPNPSILSYLLTD